MRNQAVHKFAPAWAALVLLLLAGNAQAASLEKITVSSFLGELFYAEVPLKLDADELPGKVSVEIASITEYRVFEVYRDDALQSIRVEIVSDRRGDRIQLSSSSRLKSPFFNLVLKIRYGRVTHFKKIPIFLELPKSIQKISKKKRPPSVQAIRPAAVAQPLTVDRQSAVKVKKKSGSVLKRYDGWARTGRYGPIVRGDSLSTVALRLRIDHRYSLNQVMAALFEKNRNRFDQDNMNLLKAGSFLDVPSAAEVERLSKRQAHAVLADHEKRWKQLTRQPRYAAEKVAQKRRYSKRILIGKRADGVASAPAVIQAARTPLKPEMSSTVADAETKSKTDEPVDLAQTAETGILAARTSADAQALQPASEKFASRALIVNLKKKNADLQKRLEEKDKLFKRNIDAAAEAAKKVSTAAIAKLEIMVSQLQSQLDEVRKQAELKHGGGPDWIIWLLSALVAVLLAITGLLLRREPTHPAHTVDSRKADASPAQAESVNKSAQEMAEQTDAAVIEEKESFNATMPELSDELIETDTTEIEAFDATLAKTPDTGVDHLSEADVYIRYGMLEEALQQLNLALGLQADHVDAHIKKAEVLNASDDAKGFEQAVVVAGNVLTGAALERFTLAIADLKLSNASTADELPAHGSVDESEDLTEQAVDAGAVLELGILSDESSNGGVEDSVDELDELTIEETVKTPEHTDDGTISLDADYASTQELDQLLSEFEDDDEDEKKDK